MSNKISKIKLKEVEYDVQDESALQKEGGTLTGNIDFDVATVQITRSEEGVKSPILQAGDKSLTLYAPGVMPPALYANNGSMQIYKPGSGILLTGDASSTKLYSPSGKGSFYIDDKSVTISEDSKGQPVFLSAENDVELRTTKNTMVLDAGTSYIKLAPSTGQPVLTAEDKSLTLYAPGVSTPVLYSSSNQLQIFSQTMQRPAFSSSSTSVEVCGFNNNVVVQAGTNTLTLFPGGANTPVFNVNLNGTCIYSPGDVNTPAFIANADATYINGPTDRLLYNNSEVAMLSDVSTMKLATTMPLDSENANNTETLVMFTPSDTEFKFTSGKAYMITFGFTQYYFSTTFIAVAVVPIKGYVGYDFICEVNTNGKFISIKGDAELISMMNSMKPTINIYELPFGLPE